MRKDKQFLVGVVVGIIAISLIGCATVPRTEGERAAEAEKPALSVAPNLRFDDVPIPSGFRLLQEESFTFQNDYLRVGLLKYTGKAKGEQIVVFYREQMPLYNWSLINLVEYGRRVLNFKKDNQICVITIESTMTKTNLTISIAPKAIDVKRVTK